MEPKWQAAEREQLQQQQEADEPDESDDDSEDEDAEDYDDVQRPVLGFGDGPETDSSALDYLLSVRAEARRCPKVVVAKQPVPPPRPASSGRPAAASTAAGGPAWPDPACRGLQVSGALTRTGDGAGATPDWAPGPDWQAEQLAAFDELRRRLFDSPPPPPPLPGQAEPPRLPKAADARAWRAFCYGTGGAAAGDWKGEDSDGSEGSDDEEAEADEADGGPDGGEGDGHAPLVSLVLRLPRHSLLALIGHHAAWLTGPEPLPFTDRLGQWLFALLAALRTPVTSEEADTLRRLARACRRERLRLPGGLRHPAAVPMCLVVCLVARYFGQADLGDP